MSIKYVVHHPDRINSCPNKPRVLHVLKHVTKRRAFEHLDAHACENCLSNPAEVPLDVKLAVTKKRYGAPWHRPDAAGVCRDCGWLVPDGQQ